jgi:2',3'-cyclic-nucleotide 2'-phosphodiesterase (5'-nucleotidase family)
MSESLAATLNYNQLLFVQINDLYHIDACADYRDTKSMLVPRVATVIKRLRQKYGEENVIVCLPGDFLAPSCLSQLHHGEHMVQVLNQIGVNFVCPGNHEFDLDQEGCTRRELVEQRMQQSDFRWLLTNLDQSSVKGISGLPFHDHALVDFSESTKLILVGLLMPMTLPDGAGSTIEPSSALKQQMETSIGPKIMERGIRGNPLHLMVALTHLDLESDRRLAAESNLVHMLMGGHDHNAKTTNVESACLITKAASNARTIRLNFVIEFPDIDAQLPPEIHGARQGILFQSTSEIHHDALRIAVGTDDAGKLDQCTIGETRYGTYDASADQPVIFSSLALNTCDPTFQRLVPPDPATVELIQHWVTKTPDLDKKIEVTRVRLELEDAKIRSRTTNFAVMTAEVMRGCFGLLDPPADAALIPGGTFRLDRDIEENEHITQRLLRDIFYYNNSLLEYSMLGDRLLEIIQRSLELEALAGQSADSEGNGEFLQVSGLQIIRSPSGKPTPEAVKLVASMEDLEPDIIYRVVVTDYFRDRSKEYKNFFAGLNCREVAPNLRDCVAQVLKPALEWLRNPAGFDLAGHGWAKAS